MGTSKGQVIILPPEGDLIARLDTEFVTQFLRNDDLALHSYPMSHTSQYNFRALQTAELAGQAPSALRSAG